MKFMLKLECPVCGRENDTTKVCLNANPNGTHITATFFCVGSKMEGCKTEYKINACGKTAENLARKLEFVKD